MRGFRDRDLGALGAALLDKRLMCEVIADGIHVHPAALKLLISAKGIGKVALITDSTRAQGVPPKRRCGDIYKLGDGTLYGTALTLNKALGNIVKFLDLKLVDAVKLVSQNPARLLRIDKTKGSLCVGCDADIVVLDKDFKVKMTIVEGRVAYKCAG